MIRERMTSLLANPGFATVGRAFRAEIETMPAPAEVVGRLVALVG